MIERKFIEQGFKKIQVEKYLAKELSSAGFTKADIMKTPMVTRVILHVTKPGLAIGKKGSNVKKITETLENTYKVENPQIEIAEIREPSLDAQAMANRIASLVESGYSWRSVSYRALRDIVRAGAAGAEIVVKGVIMGKGQRKRIARMTHGYMKKIGEQAKLVDYGLAAACPKQGSIGIKVWIVPKETVFSDKVEIPIPEKIVAEEELQEIEELREASEVPEIEEIKEKEAEAKAKEKAKPKKDKKEKKAEEEAKETVKEAQAAEEKKEKPEEEKAEAAAEDEKVEEEKEEN